MSGSAARRMRNWVGLSAAEAMMRLLLQLGVTVVLARILAPDAFGMAALILTVVTFLGITVGTPFEEGLAQRRSLRRPEIEGVYGFILLTATMAFIAACAGGIALAWWFERDAFIWLTAFTALLLFAHGPFALALALARRRKAFVAINLAHLAGNGIGAVIAIASGLLGAGIWALLVFRLATVWASALALFLLLGLRLRPRLRLSQMSGFDGFAWIMLKARGVENATYLMFNVLVAQFFGIAALGIVNMALRIVEPVRGAVAAIGHNLSFPIFKAARDERARLHEAILVASGQSAMLTAPVFTGLAAISPLLIPLLAGPGWDEAAGIAAFIAIGGMLLMPSQIMIAAFTASGRPSFGLHASLVGVLFLGGGLFLGAGGDIIAIGVARFVADLAQVAAVFIFGAYVIRLAPMRLLGVLAAPWTAAMAMALAVTGLAGRLPSGLPGGLEQALLLAFLVLAGVVIYAGILFLIARERLRAVLGMARPARASARPEGASP